MSEPIPEETPTEETAPPEEVSFPPFGENLFDAEGNPVVTWDFVNSLRVAYNSDGTTTTRPFTETELAMVADKQASDQLSANRAALLSKAHTALSANATFLAIASPTTAQAVTQVKALTRQINALIKLELNDLADVSGT